MVGALILQVFDWRMTFCALGAVGVFCCALAVLFEETLPQEERYRGTVLGSIGQLGAVARNKGFSSFLAIVGPVSYTHLDVYKRQRLDLGCPQADQP